MRGWPRSTRVTAARLAPNDSQRIQRALEVWHASGRPLSSFISAARGRAADAAPPGLLFARTQDRAWLHARIAQRFDAMLAAGFLDEVKALRARGDLDADLPSMRCVGYRQAWEALDGDGRSPNCANAASPPRASSPSARSPGCAACRSGR